MLPNYRGLLAIIPPAVLRALTSQSAVLRFSRAAILAGLLPVCRSYPVSSQAKFCLFSETPDFRVLRPSPPASAILRGALRNFPKQRSGADWGIGISTTYR